EVDEDAGSLDVAEELVPQAGAGVGPFDQPGDVGHDERAIRVNLYEAKVGMLGGERVGGDLRPGAGKAAEQRALAGVGHADQADVGDQLQLQPHGTDLAWFAGGRLSRGPISRRFEAVVALAAVAAAGHHDLVAILRQVFQYVAVLRVDDHGARWNGDRKILAGGSVAVGPSA